MCDPLLCKFVCVCARACVFLCLHLCVLVCICARQKQAVLVGVRGFDTAAHDPQGFYVYQHSKRQCNITKTTSERDLGCQRVSYQEARLSELTATMLT